MASLIGKPIRSGRVTAQKDLLKYARVLIELNIGQTFPDEMMFTNKKGMRVSHNVLYDCKPIILEDCKGIGHAGEQSRQKKYELGLQKVKPRKQWVVKANLQQVVVVNEVNARDNNHQSVGEGVGELLQKVSTGKLDMLLRVQ